MNLQSSTCSINDFVIKYGNSPDFILFKHLNGQYVDETNYVKISKIQNLKEELHSYTEDGETVDLTICTRVGNAYKPVTDLKVSLAETSQAPMQQNQVALNGVAQPQHQFSQPTQVVNTMEQGQIGLLQYINSAQKTELESLRARYNALELKYDTLKENYTDLKADLATKDRANEVALAGVTQEANKGIDYNELLGKALDALPNLINPNGRQTPPAGDNWKADVDSEKAEIIQTAIDSLKPLSNEDAMNLLTMVMVAKDNPAMTGRIVEEFKKAAQQQQETTPTTP